MPVFNAIYLIESSDWFDDGIFIKFRWTRNHLGNQLFTIPHVFNSKHQILHSIHSVFEMYVVEHKYIEWHCCVLHAELGWILAYLSFCWSSHTHKPKHKHTHWATKHFHIIHIESYQVWTLWNLTWASCAGFLIFFSSFFRFFYSTCRFTNFICDLCVVSVELSSRIYNIVRWSFIIITGLILHNSHIQCMTQIKVLKYEWHLMQYAIQYFLYHFHLQLVAITCYETVKWKAQYTRETQINSEW